MYSALDIKKGLSFVQCMHFGSGTVFLNAFLRRMEKKLCVLIYYIIKHSYVFIVEFLRLQMYINTVTVNVLKYCIWE